MSRRARRKFTDDYKAEVVELVRSSGKSPGQIARELDLTETAVRACVEKAGKQGMPPRKQGAPAEDERVELKRLREENRVLRMERDFLKKAAAFFARETK